MYTIICIYILRVLCVCCVYVASAVGLRVFRLVDSRGDECAVLASPHNYVSREAYDRMDTIEKVQSWSRVNTLLADGYQQHQTISRLGMEKFAISSSGARFNLNPYK
jgi:hypothetical protein